MPSKKVVTLELPKEYENFDFKPWINYIYQLLDDQEILSLAKMMRISVDGFDAKKLQRAPKSMLRRTTLEKLAKLNSPLHLIVKMNQAHFEKMKDEQDPQVLLWRLRQEGARPAAMLALISLDRAEYFLQVHRTVKENLDSKRDPFYDMIQTPELDVQARIQMTSKLDVALKRMVEVKSLFENEKIPEEDPLKHLREHMGQDQIGAYLSFAARSDVWKQWESNNQEALLQLVMLDAIHLVAQQNHELQSKNDQFQKFKSKHEVLEVSMSKQDQEIHRLREQIIQLEEQLKLQRKTIQMIEKERDDAIKGAKSSEPSQGEPILNDERVKLVLFRDRHELLKYINQSSLVVLKHTKDLAVMLQSLDRELLESLFWFIESNECSTKDMFYFEKILRMHKATFRFISGSDTELIRQMIYYLEGDMRHETS
jgi:hypothetical protein